MRNAGIAEKKRGFVKAGTREVLENHKRYLARKKIYKSFGYSLDRERGFILEQAKQRNLNVITIGERQNLKNRRTEILVTNYKNHATLFDF